MSENNKVNISEQIFKSVDEIVSARLNQVTFDKTVKGIVQSLVPDTTNQYWVAENTTIFKALALDGAEYKANDEVYVTVQNGDYQQTKIIIGRYKADDLPNYLWSNPFEQLAPEHSVELVRPNHNIIAVELSSNGVTSRAIGEAIASFNTISVKDYNYIGLEFQLLANLTGELKGNYYIQLELYDAANNRLDDNTLVITSKELL